MLDCNINDELYFPIKISPFIPPSLEKPPPTHTLFPSSTNIALLPHPLLLGPPVQVVLACNTNDKSYFPIHNLLFLTPSTKSLIVPIA